MAVVIGKIIHELVKSSGLKAKIVADYINVSQSTLFGIYKRDSVDIDKLILFSKLLNQNLFIYYLNEEPLKSMFGKDMIELKSHILELENELKTKDEKLKDLTEIIEAHKKIISLHEANVSKATRKSNK
ncbi:helix-turn-helix domain containing protein [Mucilaginibacter sp. BJC16-A38]|uniref:helix-turn-helix domain containing protein n=1 Tax=Mucilaginibacter phenanthrenivorans TaxID=1234842 RepID=UPI0021589293|nr:helix-turn-helix domain containing protein [Mucilaginibacter phenanthrenivorans]MCR8562012.1 helix-turn-helix domain containing protein [Mucilaginibacter phenanthrenivorans]